ncbi:MAG: UvrD-helicase domain-containing protein [Spirochaetota bacterium]
MRIQSPKEIDLDRHGVIKASAGTGKTYTMVELVMRLLLGEAERKPISLDQILIVTYTEKATTEMKERIRTAIEEQLKSVLPAPAQNNLQTSLESFGNASIYTIHGFCHELLKSFSFEQQGLFSMELVDDKSIYPGILNEIKRVDWNEEFPEELQNLLAIEQYQNNWDYQVIDATDKIPLESEPVIIPNIENFSLQTVFSVTNKHELLEVREFVIQNKIAIQQLLEDNEIQKGKKKNKNYKIYLQPLLEFSQNANSIWVIWQEYFLHLANKIGEISPSSWEQISENSILVADLQKYTEILQALSTRLQRLYELFDWQVLHHFLKLYTIRALKARIRQHKAFTASISFQDMLLHVQESLHSENAATLQEKLCKDFQYVFVDEFQDTDAIQWDIFRLGFLMNQKSKLFVIGDEKQSIYGFRNADVYTYIQATEEMQQNFQAKSYTLATNWRSLPEMIQGLNAIFSKDWFEDSGPIHFTESGWPEKDLHKDSLVLDCTGRAAINPVVFAPWSQGKTKAYNISGVKASECLLEFCIFIAEEIEHICKDGNLQIAEKSNGQTRQRQIDYRDICILVRKKSQVEKVELALGDKGIPHHFYKKEGIYQSPEADHLYYLLMAIMYSFESQYFKKALLSEFFVFSYQELEEMDEEFGIEEVQELFLSWQTLAKHKDWPNLFQSILQDTGFLYRCLQETNLAERKIANYKQIMEKLEYEAYDKNLELLSLCELFKKWRRGVFDAEEEEGLFRIDSEEQKVQIITIHKSKGLEFPIVFVIPDFSQNTSTKELYYKFHREGKLVYDFLKQHKQEYQQEVMQEDRRLYYVALTRAKYKLYFPCLSPEKRTGWGKTPMLFHDAIYNRLLGEENQIKTEYQNCIRILLHKTSWEKEIAGIEEIPAHPKQKKLLVAKQITFPYPNQELFSRFALAYSYTSLKKNLHLENKENASVWNEQIVTFYSQEEEEEENNLLETALPGSRFVGLFLHELLEKLPYTRLTNLQSFSEFSKCKEFVILYQQLYPKYKYEIRGIAGDAEDKKIYQEVAKILWRAIFLPYFPKQSNFLSIPSNDKLTEVDFLYSYLQQEQKQLITGSIDLVFLQNNKYYILDWKTDSLDDYTPSYLKAKIQSSSYDIQYYLYVYALYKSLLTIEKQKWDFTKFLRERFGGVYYVFLRGLGEKDNGVVHIVADEVADAEVKIQQILAGRTNEPE